MATLPRNAFFFLFIPVIYLNLVLYFYWGRMREKDLPKCIPGTSSPSVCPLSSPSFVNPSLPISPSDLYTHPSFFNPLPGLHFPLLPLLPCMHSHKQLPLCVCRPWPLCATCQVLLATAPQTASVTNVRMETDACTGADTSHAHMMGGCLPHSGDSDHMAFICQLKRPQTVNSSM